MKTVKDQTTLEEWLALSKQPCWTCKYACGLCPWSHDFKPIKGWIAKPTVINCHYGNGTMTHSYDIEYCPKYEHDGRSVVVRRQSRFL